MELPGVRLRLHEFVAAIRLAERGTDDGVFVYLPSGTLTVAVGQSPARSGMVEIYSKGNYYLVFDRDLSERADRVLNQSS